MQISERDPLGDEYLREGYVIRNVADEAAHEWIVTTTAAVANELLNSGMFVTSCDSARAAILLYNHAKGNLESFLKDSSHRERLGKLNLQKHIEYCLTVNKLNVLPVLDKNGFIVNKTQQNNVLL